MGSYIQQGLTHDIFVSCAAGTVGVVNCWLYLTIMRGAPGTLSPPNLKPIPLSYPAVAARMLKSEPLSTLRAPPAYRGALHLLVVKTLLFAHGVGVFTITQEVRAWRSLRVKGRAH